MSEKTTATFRQRRGVSRVRSSYVAKFVFRVIVLLGVLGLYLYGRFGNTASAEAIMSQFDVLYGFNFFKGFSFLHVIWAAWFIDMIVQLIPKKGRIALGSKKLFANYFRSAKGGLNKKALSEHIRRSSRGAYIIFAIWLALSLTLGVLLVTDILKAEHLFLVSVTFYVCDLICVLFWCPFRLMVKAKCCTTCRIFNWDHFMMFTPMLFVNSFFSWSLNIMALVTFGVWELQIFLHPERFWSGSNDALKCASCTDKLCTQYCEKKGKTPPTEKKEDNEKCSEEAEVCSCRNGNN